jgi:primary-amine oxidase
VTSRNWEDWTVAGWYSVGEFYATTEEFRTAINSPDYKVPSPNVAGDWVSTDQHGEPLPLDEQPPPVSIAQGDQRFQIDAAENYISWMDFTFYHTVSHDRGLALFDVKFKGKRILYELSLQEVLTAYSGSDPFASQATFFDTTSGMGANLQPLVRGYDCPSHATYLPASWNEGNGTKTLEDAICIFEFDTGYPIRRHSFRQFSPHTSVAKNIQFVMRTVATVGNYDFLIDYAFTYDGAIEVSSRFSGYISATYWENEPEYGFHIHDFLSGSSHDHTLTFKADIDIHGGKNSVQKIAFEPISTAYPWSQGRKHHTFKAHRSWIQNESLAQINWAENDNAMYAIVNKDTPNRFGEYPGYRVKKTAGTIHLTQTDSTNAGKAGACVTHDFYITQQKDSEPRAADAMNQYQKDDPLVDFASFFDGENLVQEDV